jgi:hypothetical protein
MGEVALWGLAPAARSAKRPAPSRPAQAARAAATLASGSPVPLLPASALRPASFAGSPDDWEAGRLPLPRPSGPLPALPPLSALLPLAARVLAPLPLHGGAANSGGDTNQSVGLPEPRYVDIGGAGVDAEARPQGLTTGA